MEKQNLQQLIQDFMLITQDDAKLLEQSKSAFKKTINVNKYQNQTFNRKAKHLKLKTIILQK